MTVISEENKLAINDPFVQRRAKLAQLKEQGEAYPNNFRRHQWLGDILKQYGNQDHATLEQQAVQVQVAGRIIQRRNMGKASFLNVQDMSGRLQIYLKEADVQLTTAANLRELDLGDIVGIEGQVFRTKTGELSIKAFKLALLTKSLRPLPDKFHGLQDRELRYRQRYVDLIANPETRSVFMLRAHLLKAIRTFFDQRDYLEVETPMMQPLAGGALARPFITHHNALNMPLYLRIAPELYLKRLVVGGFEKVYEINRNFRNEGLSTRHNPEFTMLEFYEAYADYRDLMGFIEDLMRHLVQTLLGDLSIESQGEHYDFAKPFERLSLTEALLKYHPTLDLGIIQDSQKLTIWAKAHNIAVNDNVSLGNLQFAIFEETIEKQLRQPTFITEHPIEVSPLARRNSNNPNIADRFEFYIGGRELANGFSELNDPEDQKDRFNAQLAAKAAGDVEAMSYDEDYITALEYGLPPTAGAGIGIDRLVMVLANVASIRDVILFPLLKPVE